MSISLQGSPFRIVEREASVGDSAAKEVEMVAFPRVYTVKPNGDDLVVAGRILQKAVADTLRKEMVRSQPNENRGRSVHSDAMKTSSRALSRGQGNSHFLDSEGLSAGSLGQVHSKSTRYWSSHVLPGALPVHGLALQLGVQVNDNDVP